VEKEFHLEIRSRRRENRVFLVKELGLFTNIGHWIRVLDVVGSYMYILL
jgi:hypothetical protein